MIPSKYIKSFCIAAFGLVSLQTIAQEAQDKAETPYSRWSFELSTGFNKPIRPFEAGYYAHTNGFIGLPPVNHFEVGVRRMFNPKVGLRLDVAHSALSDHSGSGSLPFDTEFLRFNVSGVFNLGRLMNFESFSSRIGLLSSLGIHVGQFSANNFDELTGGFQWSFTPQFRLSDKFSLQATMTSLYGFRQHATWNGSTAPSNASLESLQYNVTLGIAFYPGKGKKHADWYFEEETQNSEIADLKNELALLQEKTAAIEKSNVDSDFDGVPDYRDEEPNTPLGSVVNTKGQTVNLEALTKETPVVTNFELTPTDLINQLKEQKRLVLFFTTNNVNLIDQSKVDVAYITELLKKYPEIKVELVGYADPTGSDNVNKKLSLRRAQRVKQILIRSFIEESRISAFGEGVYGLSDANTDPTSFIIARRVEVKLSIPNP
jgi:OmpA-OmpF porin, OOP family